MMDIYSHIENTSGLSKWGEDASPCGWDGIACDSRGRITSLSLQYPYVPTALADTLGNVYALKALHLIGNSSVPSELYSFVNFKDFLNSVILFSWQFPQLFTVSSLLSDIGP